MASACSPRFLAVDSIRSLFRVCWEVVARSGARRDNRTSLRRHLRCATLDEHPWNYVTSHRCWRPWAMHRCDTWTRWTVAMTAWINTSSRASAFRETECRSGPAINHTTHNQYPSVLTAHLARRTAPSAVCLQKAPSVRTRQRRQRGGPPWLVRALQAHSLFSGLDLPPQ